LTWDWWGFGWSLKKVDYIDETWWKERKRGEEDKLFTGEMCEGGGRKLSLLPLEEGVKGLEKS